LLIITKVRLMQDKLSREHDKALKAISLLREIILADNEINLQVWASAFIAIYTEIFLNCDRPFECYKESLNESIQHYKDLFKDGK
jgi:hypothetical protein